MKKTLKYIGLPLFAFLLTGCELNVTLEDDLTSEQITTTSDGLSSLVNGPYAQFALTTFSQ